MQTLQKLYQLTDQRLSKQMLKGKLLLDLFLGFPCPD